MSQPRPIIELDGNEWFPTGDLHLQGAEVGIVFWDGASWAWHLWHAQDPSAGSGQQSPSKPDAHAALRRELRSSGYDLADEYGPTPVSQPLCSLTSG